MISQLISSGPLQIIGVLNSYLGWARYFISLVLALLLWRLWTFTIRPYFYPEELRYLPYWIPYLGHALSFFKNSGALYTRGRKHFGGSRAPFMLHLAGQKIAVILSPTEASQIFKDDYSFSFDPFIDMIYRGVANVSDNANVLLWRSTKDGFTSLYPNPKEQVLVHTGNALLHKQLLQSQYLQTLTELVLGYIEENTQWDSFPRTTVLSSKEDLKVVSLHCWCRDVLIGAQSRAFFGNHLFRIEPNIISIFDQWDINSWMITYKYPAFAAKAAIQPRDKLITALTRYLDSPRDQRSGGVPFVNELEDEEKNAGLSHEDSARILVIILWGINSNVQMTAFWMLAYLLQHPAFTASVRKEIAPGMRMLESSTNDNDARMAEVTKNFLLSSCPLLNSAFNETLRVSSTGSSVRQVMKPVRIGSKTVSINTKIFMPQRQLLLAPEAFGPNAHQIDLARFAKNKSLDRHEYYKPFGGGITLCSGRVLGKREVLAFVALALWRYDIQVVNSGEEELGVKGVRFPRLDEGKPSLGISKQVEGDDMIVKIKKR